MRVAKTNQDFKKWITSLTPERKKYNFNKVYKILRQANKEHKFRHCAKQLALDWWVPLTRLTEEQLRPYRRDRNQTDGGISSAYISATNEGEEDREVLGKFADGDIPEENIPEENNVGNENVHDDFSKSKNVLQINLDQEEIGKNCKGHTDLDNSNHSDSQKKLIKDERLQNDLDVGVTEEKNNNHDITNFGSNGLYPFENGGSKKLQNIKLGDDGNFNTLKRIIISQNNTLETNNFKATGNLFPSKNVNQEDETSENGLQENNCSDSLLPDSEVGGNCNSSEYLQNISLDVENYQKSSLLDTICKNERSGNRSDLRRITQGFSDLENPNYSSTTLQKPSTQQHISGDESFQNGMYQKGSLEKKTSCDAVIKKCGNIEVQGGDAKLRDNNSSVYKDNSLNKSNNNFLEGYNVVTEDAQIHVGNIKHENKVTENYLAQKEKLNSENGVIQNYPKSTKTDLANCNSHVKDEISFKQFSCKRDNTDSLSTKDTLEDSLNTECQLRGSELENINEVGIESLKNSENPKNIKQNQVPEGKLKSAEDTLSLCGGNRYESKLVESFLQTNTKQNVIHEDSKQSSINEKMGNNIRYEMACCSSSPNVQISSEKIKDTTDTLLKETNEKLKPNNVSNNMEIMNSSEEKHMLQKWWFNYQFTYPNEICSSFVYYPRGTLDYDNETWPDQPETEEISSLLKEWKDLQKEKNMTSLETTSESDLDTSDDLLDEEISNTSEAKAYPLDNIQGVQPPLPQYPPPQAPPSPPPLLSSEIVTSTPSSSTSAPSPFSEPYFVHCPEKLKDFISNIPLPSPTQDLTNLEQQKTPEVNINVKPSKPKPHGSLTQRVSSQVLLSKGLTKLYQPSFLHNLDSSKSTNLPPSVKISSLASPVNESPPDSTKESNYFIFTTSSNQQNFSEEQNTGELDSSVKLSNLALLASEKIPILTKETKSLIVNTSSTNSQLISTIVSHGELHSSVKVKSLASPVSENPSVSTKETSSPIFAISSPSNKPNSIEERNKSELYSSVKVSTLRSAVDEKRPDLINVTKSFIFTTSSTSNGPILIVEQNTSELQSSVKSSTVASPTNEKTPDSATETDPLIFTTSPRSNQQNFIEEQTTCELNSSVKVSTSVSSVCEKTPGPTENPNTLIFTSSSSSNRPNVIEQQNTDELHSSVKLSTVSSPANEKTPVSAIETDPLIFTTSLPSKQQHFTEEQNTCEFNSSVKVSTSVSSVSTKAPSLTEEPNSLISTTSSSSNLQNFIEQQNTDELHSSVKLSTLASLADKETLVSNTENIPPIFTTSSPSSQLNLIEEQYTGELNSSVKPPRSNEAVSQEESKFKEKGFLLCKETLKKKNMSVIEHWKSCSQTIVDKRSLKSRRSKLQKLHLHSFFKVKNNLTKVFKRKSLLLRVKKISVQPKQKMELFTDAKEEQSFHVTYNPLDICSSKNCETSYINVDQYQYVDESLPGDPITCKYIVNEEQIEISFEPMTHNLTNIDLKVEDITQDVPSASETSIIKSEESYLYDDLQVSSSDDGSDNEECYTRPRIINGFGDPFIIPRSPEKTVFHANANNNIAITNLTKTKRLSKESPDLIKDQLLNCPLDQCSFIDNEHENQDVLSCKIPQSSIDPTNSGPENQVPIILETKTLQNELSHSFKTSRENDGKEKKSYGSNVRIKNEKVHLEQSKRSLIPKNKIKTSCTRSEKSTKKTSISRNKNTHENHKKISSKTPEGRKQKAPEHVYDIKTTKNNPIFQDVAENTRTPIPVKVLTNKDVINKRPTISRVQSCRTNSLDQHPTDNSLVKDGGNLNSIIKKQQSSLLSNNTVTEEASSYRPSNIRKRLTSEVENIIPIKKEIIKSVKPQTSPIINKSLPPLKRTNSLPENLSEKLSNPVLDAIVKDMVASPPPKSLVIKEPETKNYVAQPYWYNQTQATLGPYSNSTNDRSFSLKEKSAENPKNTTQSDIVNKTMQAKYSLKEKSAENPKNTTQSDIVNKTMQAKYSDCHSSTQGTTKQPPGPKLTLKRSFSHNSYYVLQKKEKNITSVLKQKEKLSVNVRNINKAPLEVKKSKKESKSNNSIKYSEKEIKKTNKCNPSANKKIQESLPSMPLIELDNNLDCSEGRKIVSPHENFNTAAPKLVEKSTSVLKSNEHLLDKPSLKISIPLSRLKQVIKVTASETKKIQKYCKGKKSSNEMPNEVEEKISKSPNSNDQRYLIDKKGICTLNDIGSNKQLQCTKSEVTNLPIVKNTPNAPIITTVNNSHLVDRANYFGILNPKLVAVKESLSKLNQNELVENPKSSLKRRSTDSEREPTIEQKRLLLSSLDTTNNQQSSLRGDIDKSVELTSRSGKRKKSADVPPSDWNFVDDHSLGPTAQNVTLNSLKASNQLELLKSAIPSSLSEDNQNLTTAKNREYSNNLQISISQAHSNELGGNTNSEGSNNNSGDITKNESLTLRVKHPSLLQNSTGADSGTQQLTKRRISVISPEALSSTVQTDNQGSTKRQTWYMEPENESEPGNPDGNHSNAISRFSKLYGEPSKTLDLINMFQMSLKIGKKEYEQINDVIKCIVLDYKQKLDVVESVKKLSSRDVVMQEIKRASKEYESKLNERGSFCRETCAKLLHHFKDTVDHFSIVLYVFLSHKIKHQCSESGLRDSLLLLLKKWIRNDQNKDIFDQSDSAFSADCEVVLKILERIDDFRLLVSGSVDTPVLNQSPGNEIQNPIETSLGATNSKQINICSMTSNNKRHTVDPVELDFTSNFNFVDEVPDPQPSTSEPLQIQEENQAMECLVGRGVSSSIESSTASSTDVTNTAFNIFRNSSQTESQIPSDQDNARGVQELQTPHLEDITSVEERTVPVNTHQNEYTSIVEKDPLINYQEIVQQTNTSQPNVPDLQLQALSQNVNVTYNVGNFSQTQDNIHSNFYVNSSVGQNNYTTQVAFQNSSKQIVGLTSKANYPLTDSLVLPTNNKFDKYQIMRQGKQQSNVSHSSLSFPYSQLNVISEMRSNLPDNSDVGGEFVMHSLDCNQNTSINPVFRTTGSYNSSVQDVTNQQSLMPSSADYPVYPQKSNFQQHPQTYTTQYAAQGHQLTNKRANQAPQTQNSGYLQPQQTAVRLSHQGSQYVCRSNTTQQVFENQNIIQKSTSNNVYGGEVANPQMTNLPSNCNPSYKQFDVQKTYHQINSPNIYGSVSKNLQRQSRQDMAGQVYFQPPLGTQMRVNTDTSQFGNIIRNGLQNSKEHNNLRERVSPQIQRRLSNMEGQREMINANCSNHAELPQVPSQITHTRQDSSQDAIIQPALHTTLCNAGNVLQATNPHMQSFQGMGTLNKEYGMQQNMTGNQPPIRNQRLSIETTYPPQPGSALPIQPNTSINQLIGSSGLAPVQNYQSQTVEPVQNRGKSSDQQEDLDSNIITEADLNKLFSLVDGEKLMDLMANTENKGCNTGQQNLNWSTSGLSISYDGTKRTALQNIDSNLKFIANLPHDDLKFNGVNITKNQLMKFINSCKEQVICAGLDVNTMTTFIGDYRTADGRSFTKDELRSLMKGVIAMNAHTITKLPIKKKLDQATKIVLIKTLQATAFKDFAGYVRVISILKRLADENDRDAQQAVQEVAEILRMFRPPEQTTASNPVIVIDD